MLRRVDDRTLLRTLLAELARQATRGQERWGARADARLWKRFRRDLSEHRARLGLRGCTASELDRARCLAAEVLVAARLLDAGCTIEHEVRTPSGRHVDFRAQRHGVTLCVHVKRAPQMTLRDAPAVIPTAWRALEQIERGLVVALSCATTLRGKSLHTALDEAAEFVGQASVGDELTLRDQDERALARVRVVAPSTASRVEVVADLSASFDDHVPRFQATLRKAFAQFMPRNENLIVVCGTSGGFEPFATALLGSHIERWDKRPRSGALVAYGRGGDGFWAGTKRNQSRLAVYWTLAAGSGPLLFLRESTARSSAPRAVHLAREIFA